MQTEENAVLSLGAAQRAAIEEKFASRRKLAAGRDEELFGIFAGPLSEEEEWALKFLYANMPVNDLADYDGELFLIQVRHALEMRSRMPWGAAVPDELFLHYVLPVRINNERLEDYRSVIAAELADRVSGLSMTDAVLETNYWCYEKATYTGSDARTISPLGMMRSAKGRCGEESTLATAALRSVGIPARQCYTPRWAHVDDNHAWVEAWADGAWHFIGACEPEPRLDRGWFDGPARRAMLVHTRVPAGYAGPEPVTYADSAHTEINLLANYAPVRTLEVRVNYAQGRPADGAQVQFQLYNYAELHPMASMIADASGSVRFATGYGDLFVRAALDGRWAEAAVPGGAAGAAGEETIELTLDRSGQPEGTVDFDLTPPREIPAPGEAQPLTERTLRLHRERMSEGERIRAAYEKTFATGQQAGELAARLGLDAQRVFKALGDARGSAEEIADFLAARTPEHGEWPLRLLESLTSKDLIDTDRITLDDHLLHGLEALDELREYTGRSGAGEDGAGAEPSAGEETFAEYVLCPRVRHERLAPYRARLRGAFSEAEQAAFRADPQTLARRIAADWTSYRDLTPVPGKASPAGTFGLRAGDRESAEILLVALCRSFGIPARLHPASQQPQALIGGAWRDLERPVETAFAGVGATTRAAEAAAPPEAGIRPGENAREAGSAAASVSPEEASAASGSGNMGALRLLRDPQAAVGTPEASYRENFTLALLEHGFYSTLTYPFRLSDVYGHPFELEAGDYRMTTGIRLQDGRVLGRMFYIRIEAGQESRLTPVFRHPGEEAAVLGGAPGGSILTVSYGGEETLAGLAGPGGAIVAWIDHRLEPTRHLLREAGELKAELEQAAARLLFISREAPLPARGAAGGPAAGGVPEAVRPFVPAPLPEGAGFAHDPSGAALAEITAVCPPSGTEFPHLYVLDSELNIRYAESGYKPGSCREALNVLLSVRGR
ncbi:transglutaminase domain-containing protein [Saccharibacillus sp. CPCC 101409]|uniref:transglutaminase domain-containing protein n=1 Tax=Saccharibacillus sp. CPCC 101409 TaxID=3058041 RepID=UPI002671B48A|nr:transglutaminase domain-containing protein [Saccharibacillus sp. CPCC 101409]MDO3411735.1 transglutaminase domain-containing protein [Saccharibacillus sp. CPCC 101409]